MVPFCTHGNLISVPLYWCVICHAIDTGTDAAVLIIFYCYWVGRKLLGMAKVCRCRFCGWLSLHMWENWLVLVLVFHTKVGSPLALSPCPFIGGKGLVSTICACTNLPGKHGKPEITVKLPYGRPETTVGSLCCVKMVLAPPNSQ